MSFSEEFVPGPEEGSPQGVALFGVTVSPVTIAGVVVAIGLAAALFLYFRQVKPIEEQNQTLQTEIDNLAQQVQAQQANLKQLGEAEEALAVAQERRDELLEFFATSEVLDTLLIDFERLVAQDESIELKRFTLTGDPAVIEDGSLGEAANGLFKRQNLSIEVLGKFPNIQAWLRKLEQLEPIVRVSQLSVVRDGQATVGLEVSPDGQVSAQDDDIELKTTLSIEVIVARSQAELDAEAAEKAAAEAAAAEVAAPAAAPPQ